MGQPIMSLSVDDGMESEQRRKTDKVTAWWSGREVGAGRQPKWQTGQVRAVGGEHY